jgi:hypothetical protein
MEESGVQQRNSLRASVSRLLSGGALLCLSAPALAQGMAALESGGSVGSVFRRMVADPWISRSVSLADLGVTGAVVLGYPDSLREIYLPVPPGVPLADATLHLEASYTRAEGGRTTLVVSLDGSAVAARSFTADKGDAGLTLPVEGRARPTGFVRLSLDWRSVAGSRENTCAADHTSGNLLRIEPGTKFTYRYDGTAVRDLSAAWASMPPSPVVLISSRKITANAYDAAWRIALALERAGKRPQIRALPTVGEEVDLRGVSVPPSLRSIPAFAEFKAGGKYKIRNAAEIGALMVLGHAGPLQADVIVADEALAAATGQPLEHLSEQIRSYAPGALSSFQEWRTSALSPWRQALKPGEVRLANVLARPTIFVAPDAGAKAAGLFTQFWQQAAASTSLVVQAADEPKGELGAVPLKYLGAKPVTMEVLARADWNASFDIGAVASEGRGPVALVIDLSVSPGAARSPPVASVFLNEVLLGAKEMEAQGRRERIMAPIPRYALAAHNAIRVSFVRQLATNGCRESPEPYPVSVLPTSHLMLDKVETAGDFSGLMVRFARGGTLLVPRSYLDDATRTLPRVIRLAGSTGLVPSRGKFVTVAEGVQPKADGPFLALDLSMPGARTSGVKIEGDKLSLAGSDDKPLLDVTGLNHVGLLEIVKVGSDTGAIYRTLGAEAPLMQAPLLLSSGNVALLGMDGLRTEVNTLDPSGQELLREISPSMFDRGYWWLLPIVVVVLFVGLLVVASRARRRKKSGAGH